MDTDLETACASKPIAASVLALNPRDINAVDFAAFALASPNGASPIPPVNDATTTTDALNRVVNQLLNDLNAGCSSPNANVHPMCAKLGLPMSPATLRRLRLRAAERRPVRPPQARRRVRRRNKVHAWRARAGSFCVIPAFRAAATIADVVARALAYASDVVVVDDACPEGSGAVVRAAFPDTANVHVLQRERNGGVGAAMKTGIAFCMEHGAGVIVKLDADGQMDPAFVPVIGGVFETDPTLVCVKGNRFFDSSVMLRMPKRRLFGNAVLSILVKFASGYWNLVDPTNGYVAFNARLLAAVPWRSFADSYFFEISVLCELGLRRLPILELEMPTIYNGAPSSLSIPKVLWEFPPRLLRLTLRRILLQYFVFDVNLASLYLAFGALLLLGGGAWGAYQWIVSSVTHVSRSTGTVMLAVLPFLMGFQLVLNALMVDVQFAQKTSRLTRI